MSGMVHVERASFLSRGRPDGLRGMADRCGTIRLNANTLLMNCDTATPCLRAALPMTRRNAGFIRTQKIAGFMPEL